MKKLILFALLIPSIALSQVPIRIIDRQYVSGDTIVAGGNDVKKALDSLRAVPPNSGIDAFARSRIDSVLENTYVNVKSYPFNAKGDGISDDRMAIQRAIDTVGLGGGGVVHIPRGTFVLSETAHPQSPTTKIGIYLRSNVVLQGEGQGATVLKFSGGQPTNSCVVRNLNIGVTTNGDSNIVVRDIAIDGNGANQSLTSGQSHDGLILVGTTRSRVENVVVENVKGTASSGAGESFCFDLNACSNVSVINCEMIGAPYSSSGFSANGSWNIEYSNCRAHGFGICNGFTSWECRSITYSNCHSYGNSASTGFNCEYGENIVFANCIAGARTTDYATHFHRPDTAYANAYGFVAQWAVGYISYVNCVATFNTVDGLHSDVGTDIHVIGGSWRKNGNYGILFSDASSSMRCSISGKPNLDSNGVGAVYFQGVLPIIPTTGQVYIARGVDSAYSVTESAHFKNKVLFDTDVNFGTNIGIQGYVGLTGQLYHSTHLGVLNKVGNAYRNWAARNISGSDAVIDLNYIGSVTAGGSIAASGVTVDSSLTAKGGHFTQGLKIDLSILNAGMPDSTTAAGADYPSGTLYKGSGNIVKIK